MEMDQQDERNDRLITTTSNEETLPDLVISDVQHHGFRFWYANVFQKRHFLEPTVLLFFTGVTLAETLIPNVIELHYCRSVLNITDDVCLNNTSNYENDIQKFTSRYQMYKTVTEVLLPAILSVCVGTWSDVFGRKPLLLSSCLGFFMAYSLWTWISTFRYLHPLSFLICSIPIAFTGGQTIFILAMFCFMCDITTVEERAFRLGVLQAALFAGALIGPLLCPLIAKYSYTAVFGAAATLCYVSLLYIYFLIEESVDISEESTLNKKKNPLDLDHMYELIDTVFNKLTPLARFLVLCLMLAECLSLTVMLGESSVLYLFLQDFFGWDLEQFTIFNSFGTITIVAGTFGGLWLFCTKLKLHNLLVLSICTFLRLLSCLIFLFSVELWQLYLSRVFCMFTGVVSPLVRSFISEIVPHNEVGKIFSLISTGNALIPIVATFFYTTTYSVTLTSFPEAIFLLSSILILLMLYMFTIIVSLYIHQNEGEQQRTVSTCINSSDTESPAQSPDIVEVTQS